ncbi:MAG: hydroxylamine oxidation protein HaoB [Methylococcales bacterium]|nr:hydroxylamine oxidation protein HaoB [Methylococcales bacterium]
MHDNPLRRGALWMLALSALVAGVVLLVLAWQQPAPAPTAPAAGGLRIEREVVTEIDEAGRFPAQAAFNYQFLDHELPIARWRVIHYQAGDLRRAVIAYPSSAKASVFSADPGDLRQQIWLKASQVIAEHAPDDALFLGWWDDSQRIHFATGRETWLTAPGEVTLQQWPWSALAGDLPAVNADHAPRLAQLARWLTMPADQALAEIARTFQGRSVYFVVTKDLLSRIDELARYQGNSLALIKHKIPGGGDLHGDIAQVQRWAREQASGNYLLQKEQGFYRVWATQTPAAEQALLVRLLPFAESLKRLPTDVSLVWQSGWGGYLSVYQFQ